MKAFFFFFLTLMRFDEFFSSFFEIYNEKVRDLLVFDDDRSEHNLSNFSLRVREHPKLGPYVQSKYNTFYKFCITVSE